MVQAYGLLARTGRRAIPLRASRGEGASTRNVVVAQLGVALAALVTALGNCGAHSASGNVNEGRETLKSRLISEYPAHAARLRAAVENIHCKFRGEASFVSPKRNVQHLSSGDFYRKGASREVIRAFGADDENFAGQENVFCATPERAFELGKLAPETQYFVKALKETGKGDEGGGTSVKAAFYIDAILLAALQTQQLAVTELLERASTVNVEHVDQGGKSYLRVVLQMPEQEFGYKTCTLLLDPEMEYAVHEYEAERWPPRGAEPGRVSREKELVECQRTKEGYVVPRHVRQEETISLASGETTSTTREYRVEVVSIGDVDDAQFTLAAFGLPEIALRGKAHWYPLDRWYFWLLVGVSFFGWMYVRKKARVQQRQAGG